ncbi:Hypothetical protein DHA2_154174 [Giardia duodenalis]|uniref:Uncharacterized protein n=1 Tax=Giardia intestinalis TaxID=5741 RepID=V6T8L9_GIAIN|nr:Hypothetical protein DHA2_154174 [Giardia intestinalis]
MEITFSEDPRSLSHQEAIDEITLFESQLEKTAFTEPRALLLREFSDHLASELKST